MTAEATKLVELLTGMKVHRVRGSSSPHKPLLAMWAAARLISHPRPDRTFTFDEAEGPVGELLKVAGRSPRVHYPFIRMRNEPFWEFRGDVEFNSSGDVACVADLHDPAVRGGYRDEFDQVLRDPTVCVSVIDAIADHWLDARLRDAIALRLQQQGVQP